VRSIQTLEPTLLLYPKGQLGTAAVTCSIRMDRPAFCSTSEGCAGHRGARGADMHAWRAGGVEGEVEVRLLVGVKWRMGLVGWRVR